MDFRTAKCTHNEKGMCIHCLVNRGKKQQRQKGQMIEEKTESKKIKCTHPAHMKCLQCLPSQIKQTKCQHPDYEQCKNCQNFVKYETFQRYIQKLQYDCKHKKPCPKCVPPLSRKTYAIDKTCRNHLPYPQAQCDACMAPTITIKKQQYSHVAKVQIKTPSIYKIAETKAIGVLIGTEDNDIIDVHDIYFPDDQQVNQGFISPQSLGRYSKIFSYFGMKEVGIIYNSSRISSISLMMSSLLQQDFSLVQNGHEMSKFITMRLQYGDEQSNFDPHFQCFMISDQFQSLHRHNLTYEKQQNVNYFDLITAKHETKLSEHPTFLRQGVQTDIIYYKEIICWIPTSYEQSSSSWAGGFQQKEESSYPFFTIQNQNLDHMKILVNLDKRDPLEKYRNIQFLLHLTKLIGLSNTMIFLNSFFLDSPDLFLEEKIQQCQNIEQAKQKQKIDPNFYKHAILPQRKSTKRKK